MLEWRHAFDDRNVGSLVAQHNRIRFPDPTLQGNNVNQTLIGTGWAHALNSQGTTFIFGSVFFGREHDTNDRVDGFRAKWAARASSASTAST